MTLNTSEGKESFLVAPSLLNLRDKLNLCSNMPEKELTVRNWKNELLKQSYTDMIAMVHELYASDSAYVKNTLLPMLQDSLQTSTLDSILALIQTAYSSKPGRNFSEKKHAIKEKIKDLYSKNLLDNKLIFWLGILLYQDPKKIGWNFEKNYNAGTFRNDIKKRMYSGDRIHESFWNEVTDTAPQKAAVTDNTIKWVEQTLSAN